MPFLILACSTGGEDDSSTQPANQTAKDKAADGKQSSRDTSTTTPPPATEKATAQDPATCAKTDSYDACYECCVPDETKDPIEMRAAASRACLCTAGVCQKECKSFKMCNGAVEEPDAACNDCIASKHGACYEKTEAACKSDPACAAAEACLAKACNSKAPAKGEGEEEIDEIDEEDNAPKP